MSNGQTPSALACELIKAARSEWLTRAEIEYSLDPTWGGQALGSPKCVPFEEGPFVFLPTERQ